MSLKWFLIWLAIAFGLTMVLNFFVQPVSAYPYVMQGDNVTMGGTYDLSGVYGWTGKLGWWSHSYDEGGDTLPDLIVDLNDERIHKVTISPPKWALGRWYQWDGVGDVAHGNAFVFKVVRGNVSENATPKVTTVATTATTLNPTPEPTIITLPPTPTPTPVPTVPTATPSPAFPKPGLPVDPVIPVIGIVVAILTFYHLGKW